jgi:hypothetical protein
MMTVLIIVSEVLTWNVCKSAATNRPRSYAVSWITAVVWLKVNMITHDERFKLNGMTGIHPASNRNNFSSDVSECQRSYAFSWITSVVWPKVNTTTQNEKLKLDGMSRIYFACNRNNFRSDASECLVNAVICFVAVKDLEINVAELLNARELDFCFGYASGRNVSFLRLIL